MAGLWKNTCTRVTARAGSPSSLIRLRDALDENDDVQNIYTNFDLPDELLAKLPLLLA